MRLNVSAVFLCVFAMCFCCLPALADEKENVAVPKVTMLLDVPLRDTSICIGPDNVWYMTGTIMPFWEYNKGIQIWKSRDEGKNWDSLGLVWEYGKSPWHKRFFDAQKPLWAPEIFYFKDTFWLTYSLPMIETDGRVTSGCGLLKSSSGKPEGPYEDVQPNEPFGDEIDASLFQDDDGQVYYVWHCGHIARMNDDMTGLVEKPRRLATVETDSDPRHHSGLCKGIFAGGEPYDHVGYEGVFLFKVNDTYFLSCAEVHNGRYSCMISTSKNLYGPYDKRVEAIPYAGHNMFFKDKNGQWWSTYFGSGYSPVWSERPGIISVEIDGERIIPETINENK